MTPEELYRYDLRGYLYIENAIEPDLLKRLSKRLDAWQEKAQRTVQEKGQPTVEFYDIVNKDEDRSFVDLVINPRVLPYVDEMVQMPRLKSTWVAFKWKGGHARDSSNHTPSSTCNFYHFNGGRIYHNLFQVFYAIGDVAPGGGGMKLIPGSHKANIPLPKDDVTDLEVEIPMKAGSVLLFSHDVYHASLNATDNVRRVVIYTYCPGVISNSFDPGYTLYDRLFEEAPEGSWRKYLLRRPQGAGDSYPKPQGRAYDAG